jgi:hypothetical protein
MPFGLPGTEGAGGGAGFLGRIEYNAKTGFWTVVKRVQVDGDWTSARGKRFENPTLIMDFGSLEVGWIKFSGVPDFILVPYGREVPRQPGEQFTDENGTTRNAYLAGIRIKVANQKVFGDEAAHFFASTALSVLMPLEATFEIYQRAEAAARGFVPVVQCTGTTEIRSGRSSNYQPVFKIVGWESRWPCFGARTVNLAPQTQAVTQAPRAPEPPAPNGADEPIPALVTEPVPTSTVAGMPKDW